MNMDEQATGAEGIERHFDSAKTILAARSADGLASLEAYCRYYSGYVREAALRRCVELAWPELLPLIVERLNDWVPEIRDLARQAVMTLLPSMSAPASLAILPLILRLHSAERSNHADWLKQFERTMVQALAVDDLIAGAQGGDINLARACVQLLSTYQLIEASALIDLILNRNDDIVLANRAVALCARLPPQRQSAAFRAAAKSHFGPVRTTAIRALLTMADEPRREIATAALSDPQPSVRSAAISYLTSLGVDLRAYYRAVLLQPDRATKQLKISLSSLASLRNAQDVDLMKSFLDSDKISVRLAALAGWIKLAEYDKDLVAAVALADAAPGVRRLALQLVRKHGAYLPFATVQHRLEQLGDVELLLQFAESKKWPWLECIARLSLSRDVEQSVALGLDRSLRLWLQTAGGRYEQPDAEQTAFLSSEEVIDSLARLLGSSPTTILHLKKVLAHQGLPCLE